MAGVPGGHDAVEEVHPPGHRLDDIGGGAHPHEVAGLVLWHMRLYRLDDGVHHLGGLPHRQPADGVAAAVDFCRLLHVPHPQVLVGGPLVDAEQHLSRVHAVRQGQQAVLLRPAPLQPPQGTLAGRLGVLVGGRIFHALVKGHGHVAAQVGLDLHGLLRPHEDPPPVDVGGEGNSLLRNLPQSRQGEHLETAGVGEHRPVPVHKTVKPPQLLHHPIAGAQVQVVGVGQLDLTAQLLQIQGGHRPLDGSLSAHVHKHRGLGRAVGAGELPPAGLALGFRHLKHDFLLIHS